MSNKKLINAIYDLNTGKAMLAHPTKENVYVSPAHYKEITSDMHEESETNCTYTTETVCSIWQKEADSNNMVCISSKEVKTCNCSSH